MEHVVVRYSGIGTKSHPVKRKLRDTLRQRVEDRLEYENMEYGKVSSLPGRVVVKNVEAKEAAQEISEVPGVASASPAVKTEASIEAIKEASESFSYGETFGVDANRAGKHGFSSPDVKKEVGAHVEDFSGSSVDLDNPDTLLEIDVRNEDAYLFTERFKGPGGFPAGSQGKLAALVSGGIDSPVAAYRAMVRGADILPVYFYNRPIAAEDHLMRFEAAMGKLERFNSSKDWYYYRIDMEEVNQELMDVDKGRMVLHRIIMFRVAEKIAEDEGLGGIVTGESLGQKSSQTLANLEITSGEIEKPIYRPLIGLNKTEIVEKAKQIGTFEEASIDSACSTLAPPEPSTRMTDSELDELKNRFNLEKLVEKAYKARKKVSL